MKMIFPEYSAVASACLALAWLSGCATSAPPEISAAVVVEAPAISAVPEAVTEPQAEVAEPSEPKAVEKAGTVTPPAKVLYQREDVLWIQQRLQELGYYSGRVDGSVGMATREAVKAYQRDQDIRDDGRPTAQLREFMWRNGG
jgi:hypothetical protein